MLGSGLLRRNMAPQAHATGLKNPGGKEQENRSVQSGG
jgi:hypothetical protein